MRTIIIRTAQAIYDSMEPPEYWDEYCTICDIAYGPDEWCQCTQDEIEQAEQESGLYEPTTGRLRVDSCS